MGMSITDSLEWLVARKEHYEMDDDCQELAQALEVAIDTMRKYKEIEQIYREWFSDKGHTSADAYVRIGEVLKDGNDSR